MDLLDIGEFLMYVTVTVYFVCGIYVMCRKNKVEKKLREDLYYNIEQRMMELQRDLREIRHLLDENGGRS